MLFVSRHAFGKHNTNPYFEGGWKEEGMWAIAAFVSIFITLYC